MDKTHFRASLNLALLLQKYEQDLRAFKYYKNALRIRPYSVEAIYGLTSLVKANSQDSGNDLIKRFNILGEKAFENARKLRE